MSTVLVTGATGFVGRKVVFKLLEKNYQVIVATRNVENAKEIFGTRVNTLKWDPLKGPPTLTGMKNIQYVVNLMGENIASRRVDRFAEANNTGFKDPWNKAFGGWT